jgi:hypothetical protein
MVMMSIDMDTPLMLLPSSRARDIATSRHGDTRMIVMRVTQSRKRLSLGRLKWSIPRCESGPCLCILGCHEARDADVAVAARLTEGGKKRHTLLVISMIALAAAPAAAQGRSNEHRNNGQFRTSNTRNADNRASSNSHGRYRSDDRDDDRDDDDRAGRGTKKSERTYIDSRGMECREKTQIKKDGRRSSTTKCRDPKNRNSSWDGRGTRDVNQCAYQDSRCDRLPSTTGTNYPTSRRQPTSTSRQPTMTEILGAIAAQQPRR